MRKQYASPLVAAMIGGGVTAAALLGSGVVDRGPTTTVIRQSPLALSAAPARKGEQDGLTPGDIYKQDAPGVVYVESTSVSSGQSRFELTPRRQQNVATGSGFVADEEGHILTNAHVVDESTGVKVRFSDNRTVDATIVGKDLSTDLALLKVDTEGLSLRPLRLGDSDGVEVGDPTVAIGNPFGLDRTLTTGVVSALQRQITAPDGFAIEDVIQTDAAINAGNSGGPLLDAAGRVIGVNSQIATTQSSSGNVGIAFAVPINTAKRVIPDLMRSGRVERAYLGILGRTIDESLKPFKLSAAHGVLVQSVAPGTPAAKAGIRGGDSSRKVDGEAVSVGGDVIQRIDGSDVASMDDVTALLERRKPGDAIEVELVRDGKRRTVKVTLGDRPEQAPEQAPTR
jgi:S1-C subfamily serine protease